METVRDAGAMGSDRATRRSWVTAECLLAEAQALSQDEPQFGTVERSGSLDLAPALFLASGDFCLPHQSFHLSNGFVHV